MLHQVVHGSTVPFPGMANYVRAFSAFGANVFNYRTSLDVGALASHEHGKPSAVIS